MAFRKIKGSFKNRDASTHVIEDTYLVHDTSTGELRIGDGVTPGGTVVGGGVTIQDDGTELSNKAEVLNFVGEGVSVTGSGGTKTITITADLGELQIADTKLSVKDSSTVGVGIENIRIAGASFTIDDSTDTGFEFAGHLVPSQNGVFDLGKANKRWKTAFLAAETLDIGGATISSDGTGTLEVSSSGIVLPDNSKVGSSTIIIGGATSATSARPVQLVKVFTTDGSSSLTDAQILASTPVLTLEFNGTVETVPVYTEAGQSFTLSNGTALSSADTVTKFQF